MLTGFLLITCYADLIFVRNREGEFNNVFRLLRPVLVNGSSFQLSQVSRGLMQGGPISHYCSQ